MRTTAQPAWLLPLCLIILAIGLLVSSLIGAGIIGAPASVSDPIVAQGKCQQLFARTPEANVWSFHWQPLEKDGRRCEVFLVNRTTLTWIWHGSRWRHVP